MKTSILLTITGLALAPISLLGQIFPLSTNSWDNPEFRARFLGTYGFTTDLNPSVDRAEMELFQQIQGMIGTDPRGAISRLRSAITRDSSAALDQILGNLYYQEGEIERAIAAYREAIRKFPTFFRAYQNLGRALVAEGRYAEALPMLLKAIELNGGDGSLYGLVGFCYLNEGRFSTALDAYRFAIMFQPDNIDWQKGKLSCLMRLGHYNEAIGVIYELIAREPNNVEFWTWQSNAFLSMDDSGRAAANLEILRMNGRANAASLQLLGDIYMNSGVSSLAIEAYRDSFDTGGLLPRQAIRMVEALLNQNQTDAAVEFLDRIPGAMELADQDQLSVLNLTARALLAQGDADGAAEILEQVVARDPMNGRALLLLSDYHMEKQSFADALFYAQNASKVDATRVDGLLRMARVHVMQRNFREAARELRRAHELRPAPYIADYLNRVEQAAARL
ncbi:MAG: tetratricopeptide repeat protein [Opitutales bacterium]|nr:tetratricopeptide repeat protein [Opitutales bacterium]